MNVALSELPDFTCLPGRALADHHTAGIIIAPSLAYMERAYFDARTHGWSQRADRRDADPVDARRHAGAARASMSRACSASMSRRNCRTAALGRASRDGRRPDDRDGRPLRAELQAIGARPADHCRRSISSARSGSSAATSSTARSTLDQMFSARPMLGHADYRGPIPGLYMCGSGTHPGGGVTGRRGTMRRGKFEGFEEALTSPSSPSRARRRIRREAAGGGVAMRRPHPPLARHPAAASRGGTGLLVIRRVRPRDRRRRLSRMRAAEVGRGRILADLHDAAADRARAREMIEQRVAVAAPHRARELRRGPR